MFLIEDFYKEPNETENEYKLRCYRQKTNSNISWRVLTNIINEELNRNSDESVYRRQAKRWRTKGFFNDTDNITNQSIISEEVELSDALKDLILETKKERYKLSEERIQNNVYVRKLSREETLKEIAADYASKMSNKKLLSTFIKQQNVDLALKQGILMLSDWHYGICTNNYFNVYNPDICKERVSKLRDKVIELGTMCSIKKLHIVNLSDLIAGRIHLTIRLESRYDVITQVMDVAEILAEFLTDLSQYFEIEYRDVVDNHSRLEPNKKDSLELETLVRIIPWYLKERLIKNKNVYIIENECANDIITFNVFDYNVVAIHGHKDKLNKVIDNMTNMTRRRNDLVLSAHYHHLSMEEEHECLRISNGSLMGVDQYAQDLRLTNKPSQTLIICSKDNAAEAICKINLD